MKKIYLVVPVVALVGSANAINITFDEFGLAPSLFSNANPLRNEYAGVGAIFTGPGLNDGGAILDQSSNFGVNALSGRNFLAFNRNSPVLMQNGGRPFDPETVRFTVFTNSVSIFASAGFNTGLFVMAAFNAGNNLIAMDVQASAAGQWKRLAVAAPNIDHITLTEISNTPTFVYDDLSTVPEPASMVALGLGAAALLRRRRR